MKAQEIRSLALEELEAKGRQLRGELFNAQIQTQDGTARDTASLRELRRDIARVETVLREKSGAEQ